VQGVGDLLADMGQAPFRARQVLAWLYRRDAAGMEEMTDLSKDLRAQLARRVNLRRLQPEHIAASADGTRKLLFHLDDGQAVESVLIPEADHHTLCVSTQVGCRMACAFCRTATLGFKRHLTPGEITGQVLAGRRLAEEGRPLTNLVFMGMGEPLDNLDNLLVALEHILGGQGLQMNQRKVTVSTVGRVDHLPLLGAASPVALAVSLNAPNDDLRDRLMPINRRYNLAALHKALAAYPLKPTRRITLEYVLLGGVNDQAEHARQLAKWVHGLKVKVNLIPFNPFPGAPFDAPEAGQVARFQEILVLRHITAILRKPRGADIAAACGQLAAEKAEIRSGS
jgi:23S rRNA (adenine2503-C2)-methyltransferase